MDERIIQKKLAILSGRMVVRRWPVDGWEVREAQFTPAGEYRFEGDWRPVQEHETFAALKTLFFRAQTKIPRPTTPTGKLYLYFGSPDLANLIAGANAPANFSGLEGLLRVDGRTYAGVDANHFRIPAPEAGRHELEVEFVSWLRAMCQPELRAMRAGFSGVSILEVDPDIEAAYYDLRFVDEAIPQVKDPRRKGLLAKALEVAMLAMDMTLTGEAFAADAQRARKLLQEQLAEIEPDPEAGKICLVGHTHIDTAYLWPLSETVRKCGRTFATAARLMEQYPDFHFACSQPQLYAYTQKHYPDLYREIKEWVKGGRWETTGAMWVESDCNVPSGEALVRQMSHGLAFFKNEFGTRPRVCWLPDVFGYPASLPEILKGCGVPYFMTCKLHWQSLNPFPYHLFHWEGLDGSQVLAHIPKLRNYYNGLPTPEQLTVAWDDFLQKVEYDEVMLPFGYGDGGGGVSAEMMEYAARAQQFPGLPATRVDVGEGYYERIMAQSPSLPTWVGELYLETHRGTYTTQSRTKRANRKSEIMLYEAEVAGSLANLQGAAIAMATLKEAWERVLLQQFHDILPGSSIGQVYADNLVDHDLAQAAALAVRNAALRWQAERQIPAGQVGVFNSLSWLRGDPLQATVPDPGTPFHLQDSKGRACPTQPLSRGNGQAHILFEPYEVPALGWEAFSIQAGPAPAVQLLRAWERGLENAMFRLEVDDEGQIVRLLDKRCGREVIPAGQAANVWQFFQDGPEREAAWNIHDTFEKRRYAFEEPAKIQVVENGPVRATLLIERAYRQSRISLRIQLYQRTPRIDFVANVDWQERQTMLKIAFPVEVRSSEANYEIQFGAVQRPTHRNTSWDQQKFEVCAHHWADLSEAGYGVSLLNDSRYGYDTKGNTLRLTALRGPEYPDPEADRGLHHFVYSLLPHRGDWREAETVKCGWELNVPMTAMIGARKQASASASTPPVAVEGTGIVVTALKPADDGKGWILRFYEAHGGHSQARIAFARPPKRVTATNLVEENEGLVARDSASVQVAVKPFEIRTFRLEW